VTSNGEKNTPKEEKSLHNGTKGFQKERKHSEEEKILQKERKIFQKEKGEDPLKEIKNISEEDTSE
ncbi:8479_t:CDS:2, partial [Racocetra fulgida]